MISMLQQRIPTRTMTVRPLLRIRLRMIILLLKLSFDQSHFQRSRRILVPPFGGLGLMRSAVCSRSELRRVSMQIATDSSTDRTVIP